MIDDQFWKATAVTLAVHVAYALITLVLGVLAVRLIDRRLYPEIDFIEEIKRGNLAAALVYGVLLVFVAIILAGALGR